jgi:hypothetical protein
MPHVTPSIAFESTPGLIQLRKSVGDATRFLNGIVIALETLRHVEPIHPADLQLSWQKSDDPADWDRTRAFAIRSAMVAVVDGVDRYLRVTTRVRGLVGEEHHDALNGRRIATLDRRPTVSERLRILAAAEPGATAENLLLAFDLLAAWRNEFVHGEKKHPLPRAKAAALRAAANWFHKNRGGSDILGTVTRYEKSDAPSLGDLMSLFSAAQRVTADIDERLLLRQDGPVYAVTLMEYLLRESPNPNAMLEHIFQHGGQSSSGRIHSLFLEVGGNHDANKRPNAPTITREQLDGVLGIGRNKARELFKLA